MCDLMPALPRQDLSADDVAVVEPAVDERLEGAGHAQVRGEVLERRPRVLPDELVHAPLPPLVPGRYDERLVVADERLKALDERTTCNGAFHPVGEKRIK